MYYTPSQFYIIDSQQHLSCKHVCFFQSEWKTLLILIRWLRQKPADLDLQSSQNRINPGTAGQGLNFKVQIMTAANNKFSDVKGSLV